LILGAASTGRRRERGFVLEERANAWIVREGRGPELDNEETLGQINPVDQRPDRGGFADLLVEAITIRPRDEPEMTIGDCRRRRRYRSLLLRKTASRLLAAWARVVIEPSQGIGVNPCHASSPRRRGSIRRFRATASLDAARHPPRTPWRQVDAPLDLHP